MRRYKCFFIFAVLLLPITHVTYAASAEINHLDQDVPLPLSDGWLSRAIYVVAQLGIIDYLQTGPKSIEHLADKTKSPPEPLQQILHMLAEFGIFEEISPGVFSNTKTSYLLAKSQPNTPHELSNLCGKNIEDALDKLLPSIETGSTAASLLSERPLRNHLPNNTNKATFPKEELKENSQVEIPLTLPPYYISKGETIPGNRTGRELLAESFRYIKYGLYDGIIPTIGWGNRSPLGSYLGFDCCINISSLIIVTVVEVKGTFLLYYPSQKPEHFYAGFGLGIGAGGIWPYHHKEGILWGFGITGLFGWQWKLGNGKKMFVQLEPGIGLASVSAPIIELTLTIGYCL